MLTPVILSDIHNFTSWSSMILYVWRLFYFTVTPFHHPPLHHCTITTFYWFPFRSLIFTPKLLLFKTMSCAAWDFTCGTACGARARGGGYPVWLGGVCSLVRGVTRACSLTCYPDPQFLVPAQIPFPQGTGEPSSADHLWVGPRNGDCNVSV